MFCELVPGQIYTPTCVKKQKKETKEKPPGDLQAQYIYKVDLQPLEALAG
jgi:hypothetical protein